MKKSAYLFCSIFVFVIYFITTVLNAQDIILPLPDKTGGKPLMEALNERQSIRSFSTDTLTQQQLSDLLWAAWGINRADMGKHTAPSSRNIQEIEVYVALQNGLYLYVPGLNIMKQVSGKDIRKMTGSQEFVAQAFLNLVYVADLSKYGKKEGDEIKDSDLLVSYVNTGFIAQNVYLYCASADLGCVVRGKVPQDDLAKEMKLRSNQKIILAQTVGVPQK